MNYFIVIFNKHFLTLQNQSRNQNKHISIYLPTLMQLLPNMEIIDLGLYFKKQKLLAVTDLQFGYEEALSKRGFLIPRFIHKEMMERMEAMLKTCCKKNNIEKLNAILVNGDIKHEFGNISETEWRHCVRFFKLLQQYTNTIVLVKGNHDQFLAPIARTRGLQVVEEYRMEGILFIHGDRIPKSAEEKTVKTIIIGHEHPAVSLYQWPRVEKYKAFLVGNWKRKRLIVLPSFNLATEGTDILKERLLSPFLERGKMLDFEAYIVADKPYYFGKLKNVVKK